MRKAGLVMDAEQEIRAFLRAWTRKTVDLDDLQRAFAAMDYETFHQAMEALLRDGSLTRVAARGSDFRGLPRRCRLARGRLCRAADAIQQDIARLGLAASLDFSFYYGQPLTCWQQDLAHIIQLSQWLQHTAVRRPLTVSDQQRSWDIFRNEKFLLTREGDALLHRLHLSWQDIGVKREWEPLMMAVNPSALQGGICHHLVLENKAPYHKLLPHFAKLGLASLVFGAGWKIAGNLAALPRQTGCPEAHHIAWYFGDFDWEGLKIFQSVSTCPAVEVRLAAPFYRVFLQQPAPQGKEQQIPDEAAWQAFSHWLQPEEARKFRHVLQDHRYYPQEALSAADLLACGKELRNGIGTLC